MRGSATEPPQELRRTLDAIAAAPDLAALRDVADAVHALVHRLTGRAEAEQITRLISMLNDALTRRVIDVTCGGPRPEQGRWCWIALGSEGRQEQTLTSDQDNGIVFDGGARSDTLRETLLPMAQRINEALAAYGFPLCPGRIMAGNPEWCLSLHEWQQRFAEWIAEGDPQALLNAAIFFDLRPLYGADELALSLVDWLAVNAADNRRFLFQMAENALRRKPPLGLLRDFIVDKEGPFAGTLDLKVQAATLFVDAARIYGLACGTRVSNSADRLRLAARRQCLPPDEAESWVRAFYFIQALRLRQQHRSYLQGLPMHNRVAPDELDRGEQRALRAALRSARVLQKRLALDYLAGSQGI